MLPVQRAVLPAAQVRWAGEWGRKGSKGWLARAGDEGQTLKVTWCSSMENLFNGLLQKFVNQLVRKIKI